MREIDLDMLPFPIRVVEVKALDNYQLALAFSVGEKQEFVRGIFDMKPYLDRGVFRALSDPSLFKAVRIDGGTTAWGNDIDLAPERLYTDCSLL